MFLYQGYHFSNLNDMILYALGVDEYLAASEEYKNQSS